MILGRNIQIQRRMNYRTNVIVPFFMYIHLVEYREKKENYFLNKRNLSLGGILMIMFDGLAVSMLAVFVTVKQNVLQWISRTVSVATHDSAISNSLLLSDRKEVIIN